MLFRAVPAWPEAGKNILAALLLAAAVLGPLATYASWNRHNFLHKMHTEGIETKAAIVSGSTETGKGHVYYTVELRWTAKSGAVYHGTAKPTGSYAKTFIEANTSLDVLQHPYRIAVATLPVKYLEADPSVFILLLDPINDEQSPAEAVRIAAIISLLGIAGVPLLYLRRRYERRRDEKNPQRSTWNPERERKTTWILMSILFYAMLVGLQFAPDAHAMDVKAFGAEPFGLPVRAVVIVVGTILYLPTIWVQWHAARLTMQARLDGHRMPIMYSIYMLTGGGHRHLRGSVAVVWLGGLYAFAIGAAWIAYTAMKHI